MKRWVRSLNQLRLNRVAVQAIVFYLVIITLALVVIESAVDRHTQPELHAGLQTSYGLGVILLTAGFLYWLARRQNQEIKKSEAQMRALINALNDVIFVLDSTGRFCDVASTKAAALMGPHLQLAGRTVYDVLPAIAERCQAAIQQVLQTRASITLEYSQTMNQQIHWLVTTLSPLADDRVLWVIRDMTDAKRREQHWAAMAGLSAALRPEASPAAMLPLIAQQIAPWLSAEAIALGLIDAATHEITLDCAQGVWEGWRGERLSLTNSPAAAILQAGQMVRRTDLPAQPLLRQPEQLYGMSAALVVPLLAGAQPLGILAVGRTTPFTDDEAQLVSVLGNIAAGALERASAHEQAQRRADHLSILNTLGRTLAEWLDLSQVFEQLAAAVLQLYPDMLALLVSRYDPAQQLMICVYAWEEGKRLDVSQWPTLPLEPIGAGAQSESIHRRQTLIVNDLPARLQRTQASLTLGHEPLSAIYAPLLFKGEVSGVVHVQSRVYNRFTPEDADVLSLLAGTAAVAIQNARLFEAEHQQRMRAEALAQLTTRLNAELDLAVVLKIVVEEATRALQTPAASVYLYDPTLDALTFAEGYGLPDFYGSRTTPMPHAFFDRWMTPTDRWVIIPDVQAAPDMPDAALYAECDLRTVLAAPMWRQERAIGALNVKTIGQPRTFTPDELTLLAAFAAQSAIAIENARLVEAERRQRELAEALRDSATAINSSLRREEILDQILTDVGRLIPIDASSIIVFDQAAGRVARWQGYLAPDQAEIIANTRFPLDQTSNLRTLVETGQPQLIADTLADPTWVKIPSSEWIRSFIGVPLHSKGRTLGVLTANSKTPNFYTHDHVERLQALAASAAIALDNAQLLDQTQRRLQELEVLYESSVSISSSLDRATVLNAITRRLAEAVNATSAYVIWIDWEQLRGTVIAEYFAPHATALERLSDLGETFSLAESPPLLATLRGAEPSSQTASQLDIDPFTLADLKRFGGKSTLRIPVALADQVRGYFVIWDTQTERVWSEAEIRLCQTLANQAMIAILNAQLFEDAQRRAVEQAALFAAAHAVSSSLEFKVILERLAEQMAHAIDVTSVYISDWNPGAGTITVLAEYLSPEASPLESISNLGQIYLLGELMGETAQWLIEGGTIVFHADEESLSPPLREHLKQYGAQSALMTALVARGTVFGSASLWDSRRKREFRPDEISLCQSIAQQAAVAFENARLFAAEREQRALAEALYDSVLTLSRSLELDEVLAHILSNAGRIVPNDLAAILQFEGTTAQITRIFGRLTPPEEAAFRQMRFTTDAAPNLRRIIETRQPLVVSDVKDDPGWVETPEFNWIRSFAAAPIQIQGQVVSLLLLYSASPNFFTELQAERLQAFAIQAAIAIDNARLYEAAQHRALELSALLEASQTISSTLDLNTVLQRLAEQMGRALKVTSAYISSWEPATQTTTVLAEYYSPQAALEERVSDVGRSYLVGSDLEFPTDTLSGVQPSVIHVDDNTPMDLQRNHLRQFGAQSALTIPLIAKGQVFGFADLWESRRRREFTRDEISLCQTMARHAAVALENARLFEAERKQLQLTRTLRDVGALLTATMSLDEVFEHLFDLLAYVVHYDSVTIQLLQDNQILIAASRGFTDLPRYQTIIQETLTATLTERWGQPHQRVIVITDTHHDLRWLLTPGSEPIRSWIGAALRVKGRLLGVLNVDSLTPFAYDNAAGETVAAFANQAAVAIENAHLNEAVRRHAEELETRVRERTAELERERMRTAAILDAAGEGIMLTDPAGAILYINPAMERLTGYTAVEVQGQNPRLWQSGRNPRSVYDKLWSAIKHGRIWQGELINRRKDGAPYDAALTIAPVFDLDGQINGFVGVQRDISQQKELDRLKDEFVSNVSHELRTPIANVKLYISLLTRGKPEKYDEYLQTLRREAARLEKLIEDLLDLSRLDLSTTPVYLEPTDVYQLAAQLIADRTALAAARQLLIDYRVEGDQPYALTNAPLLGQVISNLLTNAINYTPLGGVITATAAPRLRADQLWLTITIQDTGHGIAAHDLPHLFDRFYRGEVGRKSGAPGTGLGLAISAQIMHKLGGLITVESEPRQGAAFTVWLPPA